MNETETLKDATTALLPNLLFLQDSPPPTDEQTKSANQIRQIHASAQTKARYAEDMMNSNPSRDVHERVEEHLKEAVENYYLLGQLLAMPELALKVSQPPKAVATPPASPLPTPFYTPTPNQYAPQIGQFVVQAQSPRRARRGCSCADAQTQCELRLGSNSIGLVGLRALAENLGQLQSLDLGRAASQTALGASGNNFAGGGFLCGALIHSSRSLRRLNLRGTRLKGDDVAPIFEAAARHPNLRELQLDVPLQSDVKANLASNRATEPAACDAGIELIKSVYRAA